MIKFLRKIIPQWAINYFKHLPLATLALIYYRFPARKLKIIGVTGTEGKTTTVNMIYHLLSQAGLPAAMVSTTHAQIGDKVIDTGLHVTSPSSGVIQKLLRQMADEGVQYAVLEVTSIALDQFRYFGIQYDWAVLTNVARDHLDYHRTFEAYRRAKLKLFKQAKAVVLNQDDPSFEFFRGHLGGKNFLSYGLNSPADFTPKNFSFQTSLPGDYNQLNFLAAIATVSALGIEKKKIQAAITSFKTVEGRLEEINEGQNFRIFVDFAHTPNALERALKALRKIASKKRLICLFGSAGQRDRQKRPLMGAAAAKYADLIILTADDPRDERVEDICDQIAKGIGDKAPCQVIVDRREAIKEAFELAKKGDVVALCGKGHEKSLAIGNQEIPWSDQEVARELLKRKGGKK